jgi:hypothetical protein
MAQASHVFGFRPARLLDSSPYNGQTQLYGFSTSQANDAYKGDLVQFDATNRTNALVDIYYPAIPVVKPVVAALTTGVFRGVIAGFIAQPEFSMAPTDSLGTMYRLASTKRYAFIVEDINVVFEAEETGQGYTSTTVNSINKVGDIAYTAGSTLTGISKVVLDAATVSVAAVKPFRYLRYTEKVDNFQWVAGDANSRAHYDVIINSSDLGQASIGL